MGKSKLRKAARLRYNCQKAGLAQVKREALWKKCLVGSSGKAQQAALTIVRCRVLALIVLPAGMKVKKTRGMPYKWGSRSTMQLTKHKCKSGGSSMLTELTPGASS
eukprot:scaffold62004_cov30-Tisochrysis_lutea.AAC.1